jgi:hypothetical protein
MLPHYCDIHPRKDQAASFKQMEVADLGFAARSVRYAITQAISGEGITLANRVAAFVTRCPAITLFYRPEVLF